MTADKGSKVLLKVEVDSAEELEDVLGAVLNNDRIESAKIIKKPSNIKRLARKVSEKHKYELVRKESEGKDG